MNRTRKYIAIGCSTLLLTTTLISPPSNAKANALDSIKNVSSSSRITSDKSYQLSSTNRNVSALSDSTSSSSSTTDSGTQTDTTTNNSNSTSTSNTETPPDKPNGEIPGGGAGGSETGSITLAGAYTVNGTTETVSNKTISATEQNQNAVLVQNSGKLTLTKATITKTGDTTSADESNFYGVNSIVAALKGCTIKLTNSTLTSNANGANAVFATGEGATIQVSNVVINTSGDSSRGLDATYGGTIKANKMTITTKGAHCAAVATNRGEGTITIKNSTLSAAGDGSPCIYSTGDISATNVTGTATGSQAAVVEGKNSITLTKCNLTGAGKNGIMLYQSTSGDAAVGSCNFTATDSTLKTTSTGEMFYITNTDAIISLTNTKLSFSSGILLNASGNSTNNWGTPGSNPGIVVLNAKKQTLTGDITCDSLSSITLNLKSKTKLKSVIDNANTGNVAISLDSSSTWTLTGDSYITSITDKDNDLSNIKSNGYTVYYDSSNSSNSWLDGKTITLSGGGSLTPMK